PLAPFLDIGWSGSSPGPGGGPPPPISLGASYPNPFDNSTTIRYDLGQDGRTTVTLYDIRGAKVKQLIDTDQAAGPYTLTWDGTNEDGARVASGVYVCRLRSAGAEISKRLVYLP